MDVSKKLTKEQVSFLVSGYIRENYYYQSQNNNNLKIKIFPISVENLCTKYYYLTLPIFITRGCMIDMENGLLTFENQTSNQYSKLYSLTTEWNSNSNITNINNNNNNKHIFEIKFLTNNFDNCFGFGMIEFSPIVKNPEWLLQNEVKYYHWIFDNKIIRNSYQFFIKSEKSPYKSGVYKYQKSVKKYYKQCFILNKNKNKNPNENKFELLTREKTFE